jgi:D-sedoheptulose 7-phosphate isomerase
MDMKSNYQLITQRLIESAALKRAIARDMAGEIESMAAMVIGACRADGKVVIFGNGGSAADAQHIACEMVGTFLMKRQAFPAIALNTNTSVITALANDYGYEAVFSRQVEALVKREDVVIGISTSGESPNIIMAIKMAKIRGAATIGLIGGTGGRLLAEVDLALVVPSASTPRIQEAHITIGHIVCELVERELAEHPGYLREKGIHGKSRFS